VPAAQRATFAPLDYKASGRCACYLGSAVDSRRTRDGLGCLCARRHAPPTCMRRSSSLRHMRRIPSRALPRAARPVATSPSSSCECEPRYRAEGWPNRSHG
jgi:hypothetical protein